MARRRLALLVAVAAVSLPALAFAGHETSNVGSYTGCLTDTGQVVEVAVGDAPKAACSGTETLFHVSGGDITSIATPGTGGLSGGKTSGAATLTLSSTFKLPQGCASAQVPKFKASITQFVASVWECGNDNVVDRRPPAATTFRVVADVGLVGSDQGAMTVGNDGFPIIAYLDFGTHELKVAHCRNPLCTASTTTPLDSLPTIGGDPSIALGKDGFPIISYWDAGPSDLDVAHCTDAECSGATVTAVDSLGDVGSASSIAIGSDGLPLVSYYDGTNHDLKVAHCQSLSCSSSTRTAIETTGDVGIANSMAPGADGFGLISYYDNTNHDLKVAHCLNVVCSTAMSKTIDAADSVGDAGDVTIGADGLGLISYYDATPNYDLKVAHCVDVLCTSATKTTIDSTGDVGEGASSTIGADGLGLITYYDATNRDLKAAHCQNAACSSATRTVIESAGDVGDGSSLTIGPDGLPVVSYENETTHALRVAHCSNPFCVGYLRRR